MVHVVKSSNSDAGGLFIAAVDAVLLSEDSELERVVFDCEGVDLSRLGSLEIISICFSSMEVFLVDFGKKPDREILKAVKDLFESTKVIKIIHDCRMDSDALFHLHGISLKNVHDTSCFHTEITGNEDQNLNNVLLYNGIEKNQTRDSNVYKINPAFWATRPLTQKMIDWASADVNRLFDVETKQLKGISDSGKTRALDKSNEHIRCACEMKVESGLSVRNPGRFIGRRGINLRSLMRRTNTLMYQSGTGWTVYYSNVKDLEAVKSSMRG
jgi:ribonuclease D